MPARIDPFVDVLLRERGEQLYLLPDEPVTMVKDGKSRKVSRQPLTDQHIYALLVEVAPSESADRIDQMAATAPVLPAEVPAPQYQAAEQALGELLRQLVHTKSSDLHLRVGEPPIFRTHGEMKRQAGERVPAEQLELMLLAVMPERNRAEWKETGDADFAYEIVGLARFRVNAARDRTGPVAALGVS